MKAWPEIILDTGPLVAWLIESNQHHGWRAEILDGPPLPMVTSEAVVAEAAHHILGYKHSVDALCEILESGGLQLAPITDLPAVCAFMRRYQTDFADAAIVWLSEQFPRARGFTVDFGDVRVYRRFRNQSVPLIEKPAKQTRHISAVRNSRASPACFRGSHSRSS